MPRITIDEKSMDVPDGLNILQAALMAGIDIPTLCNHEDLNPRGACGLCIVEIEGENNYKRSCVTKVCDGMKIRTNTAALRTIRRGLFELILAAHPEDCLKCIKHGKCELQSLAERFEIRYLKYDKYTRGLPLDSTSCSIFRDMNKCIGCGRCVDVCNSVQSVGSIFFQGRGSDTIVAPAVNHHMGDSVCANCGQCIVYCPVGALYENEVIEDVWRALDDKEKLVITQIAPAVRVSIGEEFGLEAGEVLIGQLYAALKKLGVDVVFDTNFTADLTIMEEGTEFLNRLNTGGVLPLITSCSPGWIKFGETYYPELLENISTCKSPQQMMGALIKTYYAQSKGIDPARIVSLSIMPCTAKKFEAARPEMRASGFRDVDYVLTTRELARMLKQAGIRFEDLEPVPPDPVLSTYSGAGTIFGATGGVMEAALRTAYELKTGQALQKLEFEVVRGMEGIKEATIDVAGTPIKVAVAHGLGNARRLLDKVSEDKRQGKTEYHFIEIMACTGGCVGGGGQPIPNTIDVRMKRSDGLYIEDGSLPIRKSHENPEVKGLYEEFLEKPCGERSHHLLHTHYESRKAYGR